MSVQAIVWVLENSESRLGPRHVLLSIANHADREGCNAFPSVATIAKESNLSDREVQICLPILVELGELEIIRGVGPRGAHIYSLCKMRGAKISPVKNSSLRGEKSGSAIRKNRPEPSLTPYSPPFKNQANPKCSHCGGTGWRASMSRPGITVLCDCVPEADLA
jgi:hypothetical protein